MWNSQCPGIPVNGTWTTGFINCLMDYSALCNHLIGEWQINILFLTPELLLRKNNVSQYASVTFMLSLT